MQSQHTFGQKRRHLTDYIIYIRILYLLIQVEKTEAYTIAWQKHVQDTTVNLHGLQRRFHHRSSTKIQIMFAAAQQFM